MLSSHLLAKEFTAGEKPLKRAPLIRRLSRLGDRNIACLTNTGLKTRDGITETGLHPRRSVEILRHR